MKVTRQQLGLRPDEPFPLCIGPRTARRIVAPSYAPDPREPAALYRLIGPQGRLLYVGVARDPFTRLEQHVKSKEWWPEVDHSHIEWYATRTEALTAELYAIRTESPLYNVQSVGGHSASVRPTPLEPPTPAIPGETFYRRDDA